MTWNVGAGLAGGGLAEQDLPHVAETLQAVDPDLVFLQEVRGQAQAERLLERLGRGWAMASSVGAVALSQRGRLIPFAMERGPQLRAVGVIYQTGELDSVVAVGLHADAFSSSLRNESIGQATSVLMARDEPYKVLAGDLNLDLDLDKRADLFSDDEYLDVETYNFVNERLVDVARASGSTAEPDRRLDYVFASSNWIALASGAWKGQRSVVMDHDPVVVDLRR